MMGVGLLNFLIIAIVLCFVCALIILIVSSKTNIVVSRVAIVIHLLAAIVTIYFSSKSTTGTFPLAVAFSSFVCTGIIAFAFVVRKKFSVIVKIYFSLFILSFPLFLIAPSKVFTVMSLGLLSTENANELYLEKNYFIVREQGMIKHNERSSTYKVVKRMGMFNKTIARELYFGFTPDSALILFLDEKSEIRIRAFKNDNGVLDSMEAEVKTIASRDTLLKIKSKTH